MFHQIYNQGYEFLIIKAQCQQYKKDNAKDLEDYEDITRKTRNQETLFFLNVKLVKSFTSEH